MPFQPLEEIDCNLPVHTAVTASSHGCSTSKNFFWAVAERYWQQNMKNQTELESSKRQFEMHFSAPIFANNICMFNKKNVFIPDI